MKRLPTLITILAVAAAAIMANHAGAAPHEQAASRPNIVLVITDDQGYGDLGCTGNPIVKTPNIDALAAVSSQLSNYHVAPTCSPTRAALMTGHWTDRTGVWHTVNGRSMLREDEITVARMLSDAGYATGMFGKWHLGDNFPYRAEDRGFAEVYRHGGGGVGQTPDYWDNAYFDGHYFHNSRPVAARGFCTDVFFREAQRFIRECVANQRPFYVHIAPNAPHGPLHAPADYLARYAGQPPALAAFFAMITNIDDNVGTLRKLLAELGVAENTLFIFTTDNGTASGEQVFNAGMRGKKGSEYDGGHRVPFFAHWPAAGWNREQRNNTLCHAVDVAPTLLEVARAAAPPAVKFDGRSIRRLLEIAQAPADWPDRFLVTDSQRVRDPIKWKQTAVMAQDWRLVNGVELFDMRTDPGQRSNVIDKHPEQAARMRAFYDAWWTELEPTFARTTEIYLGHPDHPVVQLNGHDWIQEALPPWSQHHIRVAEGFGPAKPPARANAPKQLKPTQDAQSTPQPATAAAAATAAATATAAAKNARKSKAPATEPNSQATSRHQGHWAVKAIAGGRYVISVRRWPVEADAAIVASLPAGADVPGADRALRARPGRGIPVTRAVLRLDDRELATAAIQATDKAIDFTVELTAGSHRLAPVFVSDDGHEIGAYYATVTKLP
jgi:arylsulfatase A-like enzyme